MVDSVLLFVGMMYNMLCSVCSSRETSICPLDWRSKRDRMSVVKKMWNTALAQPSDGEGVAAVLECRETACLHKHSMANRAPETRLCQRRWLQNQSSTYTLLEPSNSVVPSATDRLQRWPVDDNLRTGTHREWFSSLRFLVHTHVLINVLV
jgi:hypothetical protein